MTNDEREALIEAAATAILDASETPENVRDEQVWEWARRDARAALAVFEQSLTPTDDFPHGHSEIDPTDDEREAAKAEAMSRWPLDPSDGEGSHAVKTAMRIGFKGGADWAALRRPVQGEPTVVRFAARKGGKSQALIDSMLAQANEHDIRVEVVYPQGEPSNDERAIREFYAEHYDPKAGWRIERLDLAVFIPAVGDVDALSIVREALEDAALDIRVLPLRLGEVYKNRRTEQ